MTRQGGVEPRQGGQAGPRAIGLPDRDGPVEAGHLERFTGTDETTMWKWLRENDMPFDTKPTRDIHPGARTLRDWLAHRKGQ